jgi:hypothetical protein
LSLMLPLSARLAHFTASSRARSAEEVISPKISTNFLTAQAAMPLQLCEIIQSFANSNG